MSATWEPTLPTPPEHPIGSGTAPTWVMARPGRGKSCSAGLGSVLSSAAAAAGWVVVDFSGDLTAGSNFFEGR